MNLYNNEIEAVIFDFDGTLYDNTKMPLRLISASPFSMFKMKKDRTARKQLKGIFFGTEEKYLQKYDSFVSSKWHMEKYLPLMTKVLAKKYKARPGVEQVFEALRNGGVKTAILSDYALLEKRLAAVGLGGLAGKVDFMAASQELGGLKPAGEVFAKVCEALGVEEGKILVVGDRADTDGKGAEVAGMKFVRVRTAKTAGESWEGNGPFVEWSDFVNAILNAR